MENKLSIRTKMSYGRVLYYPACRVSRIVAELAGTKTLSGEELQKLSAVGFEISYDEPGEAGSRGSERECETKQEEVK